MADIHSEFCAGIDGLLDSLASCEAAEEGLARIALAGLVARREAEVYKDFKGRGEPDPELISRADTAWLLHVTRDQHQAYRIGIGASGTALDASLAAARKAHPDASGLAEMRHGINAGTQRLIPFAEPRAPRDLGDVRAACAPVATLADHLSACLRVAVIEGLPRKSLLRLLNVLILLEEAGLVIRGGLRGEQGARRKAAIEFALTRYLGGVSGMQTASLEEITQLVRETGRAARLSNPVSDGLDRVQSLAQRASKDPDLEEASRTAERPLPENLQDLARAALQCRKFRDRERV